MAPAFLLPLKSFPFPSLKTHGFRRALFLLLWGLPASAGATVLINEVSFDNVSGSPDWIELYNAGTAPVSLDGWVLTDEDAASGNEIHLAVSTAVPPAAFLTVYIDALGADDSDFSDGAGRVFSGTHTTVSLAATEDEVGLYAGLPLSSATLVDFAAWVTDGVYGGLSDQSRAIEAGLWPSGAALSLSDPGGGYSIGRTVDGEDRNVPGDFRFFQFPTPGATNEAPPPAETSSTLTIDPRTRAFSPRDPDPAFQSTRAYYSVATPSTVKSIRVYDTRGRSVRVLMEGDWDNGGGDHRGQASGDVIWDGRDDNGETVSPGVYVLALEGTDPSTGQIQRGRTVVAVGR